jgi:histidyl-tRNA synthetase
MIKQPLKGFNDFIPSDAKIRDYMMSNILAVYKSYGYERIYTPAIEDIENIDNKEGGDNQKLIFKVLKRGDKLTKALDNKEYDKLADMGLRYDLTLPLTRFYAANRANLPQIGKFIQLDRVYRAERPQRGRDREFYQCDIDVIGNPSYTTEIELITATGKALLTLPIGEFFIRINNRQILRTILAKFGFEENTLDEVCISLDKLDKIGADGVKEELVEKSYNENAINNLIDFISTEVTIDKVKEILGDDPNLDILLRVIDGAKKLSNGKYDIVYDFTLVRGQGYYTGCVFEIASKTFGGTVGGGGRYDNLIGKFIGESVPAVGFSIGFERIFAILKESNFVVPNSLKLAIIYKGDYVCAQQFADKYRNEYSVSVFEFPKKIGKLLNRIENEGFNAYIIYDENQENNDIHVIEKQN